MNEFEITITDEGSDGLGAFVKFSRDWELSRRLRKAFPKARWHAERCCWHVPGTRSLARLELWRSSELAHFGPFANQKGRDDFAFDPIVSRYLTATEDDIQIETPYSRWIVKLMREISGAKWDGNSWRIPYRSIDSLRSRWPEIAEIADDAQPEALALRRQARKEALKRVAKERLRKRSPVYLDALPPLDRPLLTPRWGVIVFVEITADAVSINEHRKMYSFLKCTHAQPVWARWRMPTQAEWEAAAPVDRRTNPEKHGWSWPTMWDLNDRKSHLKSIDRAKRTRIRRKLKASLAQTTVSASAAQ